MKSYILTIKVERNPEHDPANKLIGTCRTSPYCTDTTGAHHSMLVIGASEQKVREYAEKLGYHVTRIEAVGEGIYV